MNAYLNISDLNLSYGSEQVLHDFNLQITKGNISALIGESGCGKTSVLRCIAGLETPSSGSIMLNGTALLKLPTHSRNVGLVFQQNALFPHMSVEQNIGFGLNRISETEKHEKVMAMIDLLKLEGLAKRKPHELSGGQQQRVAIGRTLVTQPDLLMMDEPFSDLDPKTRDELRSEIGKLIKARELTTIIVSHHAEELQDWADEIVKLD